MNKFPDYQSAKVLSFCLNIMRLEAQKDKIYFSLHKLLLRWVRTNYLKLINAHPLVAESCLIGSISLDKENQFLTKTWENSSSEPHQQFLNY